MADYQGQKNRLIAFATSLGFSKKAFEESVGLSNGYIGSIRKGIGYKAIEQITERYPDLNPIWLTTGAGKMLLSEEDNSERTQSNLIPFYDDVASIGGNNEMTANMDGVTHPSEYIDTGDWFKDATAAIRHYGESMDEYPPGCILAIKEVYDRQLIIPGRDYVIETSEYRVTKRVQRGKTEDYIRAYSTNTETYPDGQLIHEPFDILLQSVVRISLVLGYVVKKNGGTMVYNKRSK